MSLDGLITFLLDEIALSGQEGASVRSIFDFLNRFYQRKTTARPAPVPSGAADGGDEADARGSLRSLARRLLSDRSGPVTPTVDPSFKSQVWRWLTSHADVTVHYSPAGPPSSLEEAEAREAEYDADPAAKARAAPVRVCVSEDRVWRALTGHGVDWARCPRSEFQLLAIIAAHRERGIMQTDLIRLSQQDKRSLPKRTDGLHEKGYIEKRPAVGQVRGQRTSLLTLRRFVAKSTAEFEFELDPAAAGHRLAHAPPDERALLGRTIDGYALTFALFEILQEHPLITRDDLKEKMGIANLRWQSRLLARLTRKLEFLGFVKRVRAASEFSRADHSHACVKLLRVPTADEIARVWRASRDGTAPDDEVDVTPGPDAAITSAGDGTPTIQADVAHGHPSESAVQEMDPQLEELGRTLPCWRPGQPLGNLIFNLIDASGTQGLSTMSLKARGLGPFMIRPLETSLERLCRDFRSSQPAHLRHLAIIKDVAQSGRTPHYQYYSYANFQKLVDQGKASWEAVISSSTKPSKNNDSKKSTLDADQAQPEGHGFPSLPDSQFLRPDGRASLAEAVYAARPLPTHLAGRDLVLVTKDDGTFGIDSAYVGGEQRPYRDARRPYVALPAADGPPPKPRGRPRKYAKGQEPYKQKGYAKRMAEERKERERETPVMQPLTTSPPATPTAIEVVRGPPMTRKRKAMAALDDSTRASSQIPTRREVTARVPADSEDPGVLDATAHHPQAASKKPMHREGPRSNSPDVSIASGPASTARSGVGPSLSRVSFNPPGSLPVEPKRPGRKRKRLIAVIQLDRLRELDWFAGTETPASGTASHVATRHEESGHANGAPSEAADPLVDQSMPDQVVEGPIDRPGPDDEIIGTETPAAETGSPAARKRKHADIGTAVSDLKADEIRTPPVKRVRVKETPERVSRLDTHQTPAKQGNRNFLRDLGGGSLMFRRRKIILDLVDGHEGAFPGDKDLWYPYSVIWMKENPAAGKPDLKTVKKIQKSLVDSGQLKAIIFTFTNSRGVRHQKSILARRHIDPQAAVVQDLQQKMQAADGESYVPPDLGVDAQVKRMLDQSSHGIFAMIPKAVAVEHTAEMVQLHGSKSHYHLAQTDGGHRMTRKRRFDDADLSLDGYSRKRLALSLDEQRSAAAAIRRANMSSLWAGTRASRGAGSLPAMAYARYDRFDRMGIDFEEEAALLGFHSWRITAPGHLLPRPVYRHGDALIETKQLFHEASGTFGTIVDTDRLEATSCHLPGPFMTKPSDFAASFQIGHVDRPQFGFFPSSLADATFHDPAMFKGGRRGPKTRQAAVAKARLRPMVQQDYDERLPKSLEELLSRKRKGRVVNHGLAKDPRWSKFQYEVARVRTWEHLDTRLWTGRSSQWIFMNHTIATLQLPEEADYRTLTWLNPKLGSGKGLVRPSLTAATERAQALPHAQSVIHGWNSLPMVTPTAARLPVSRPDTPIKRRGRPPKAGPRIRQARASTRPLSVFKTRYLTATQEVNGAVARMDETGATSHQASGRRRRRRVRRGTLLYKFSEADDLRLVTSIVVIRILVGGMLQLIDFVLVCKALGGRFDEPTVRRRWTDIRQRYQPYAEQLQGDFQEAFVPAYEKGEVGPIDYDGLAEHDWSGLIDWVQETVRSRTRKTLPSMPAQRAEFERRYELVEEVDKSAQWRDDYFNISAALFRRSDMLNRKSLSKLVTESTKTVQSDAALRTAKSWVRANAMTSEKEYDAVAAQRMLGSLDEEVLVAAVEELRSSKVLTHVNRGRLVPGRNFEMSDHFHHVLKKTLDERQLVRAGAVKEELDRAFEQDGVASFPYTADDGQTLAVINLVASRRVRLSHRNASTNPFGLMDGDYKTRFMDKSRIYFDVDIRPGTGYQYGRPLGTLPPPPVSVTPTQERDPLQPIPIWRDIHGKVLAAAWTKAVAAVLSLTSARPGIGLAELERCTRPAMEAWEIAALMGWLQQTGAVVGVGEGRDMAEGKNGGAEREKAWRTGEWWWTVLQPVGMGGR